MMVSIVASPEASQRAFKVCSRPRNPLPLLMPCPTHFRGASVAGEACRLPFDMCSFDHTQDAANCDKMAAERLKSDVSHERLSCKDAEAGRRRRPGLLFGDPWWRLISDDQYRCPCCLVRIH